ncbi:MAG: cellulose biosynthesis cyclic di-GMP-binding regulatory protein BcsB, partial [Candidatus Binatia bacterium]
LGLFPLDDDPGHFLLIVSGSDDQEVTRAATAFAFVNFPFPDSSTMRVRRTTLPELVTYTGRHTVKENGVYRLSDLGFRTVTRKGTSPESFRIEFFVPPDLFGHEDSFVELKLHLAYGAGLRLDSVLNVILNGRFEKAIPLDDDKGAVYRNYRIGIPLRSLEPGQNILLLAPSMMPMITGKCLAIQEENLLITLFDDSGLTLPEAAHYVRLPDFRLLAKAAFPYTRQPEGAELAIQVAGSDAQTIAAAWTLIGKMAQKAGTPLHRSEVSFDVPTEDRNLLVVGTADRIDGRMMNAAPMTLGPIHEVPYPYRVGNTPEPRRQGWLARMFPWLADSPDVAQAATPVQPPSARIQQESGIGHSVIGMTFESPLHAKRSVVAVVAADTDRLVRGVGLLIEPELWENLEGDIALWRERAETLSWQKAGRDYYIGDPGTATRMQYHFSRSPWIWVSAVLLALVLLALLTRRLLARFDAREHGR